MIRWVVVLGLGVSGFLPGAQAVDFYSRSEPLAESYLWANLTWNNGKGQLVWGGNEGSENKLGTGPKPTDPNPPPPQADAYVSEPTPFPLYLNVSRLLQLDVLGKQADCPTAIVRAGDTIMAAGYENGPYANKVRQNQYWQPYPNVFVCRLRMPLEVAYLPAGSIITLTLHNGRPANFQTNSTAPSVLRFPVFSPAEASFRMPEVMPRARPAAAGDLQDAAVGLLGRFSGLAVGLMAFAGPGRMKRDQRATAVLVLLAGLALSGCLQNPTTTRADPADDAKTPGTADVVYEEGRETGLANASAGSLIGEISDTYSLPVGGAHLALLGTGHFTRTNKDGLFSFRDLAPGTYTLRIDAPTYEPYEGSFEVRADTVTRVRIVLEYDSSLAANDVPHRHDYWQGRDEILLYEGPVYTDCQAVADCKHASQFYFYPSAQDRKLVLPGTKEIEVTLEFDSGDCGYETMAFAIQDNTDTNPGNWSTFALRRSGEPFHIQTGWEMADVGHQLFSTWTFGVLAGKKAACQDPVKNNLGGLTFVGPTVSGPVLVEKATMKIKRGAIPLEPRHPDHWHGNTFLDGGSGIKHTDPTGIGNPQLCWAHKEGFRQVGQPIDISPVIVPLAVVPQETRTIDIHVNQSDKNGPMGAQLYDWDLWYKTGQHQVEPYSAGNPRYRPAPDPVQTADGLSWHWTIPVEEGDEDGIYNKKSAWRLVLVATNGDARCLDFNDANPPLTRTYDIAFRR